MPHVTCVKVTPDQQSVCAVDSGLDQVKIYRIEDVYKRQLFTLSMEFKEICTVFIYQPS